MRLGIDFGTTRTVVACADRGNYPVVSFHDEAGDTHDFFPSAVAERDGELRFGFDALALVDDPTWCLVRSFKRWLSDPHAVPGARVAVGTSAMTVEALLVSYFEALQRALAERSNLRGFRKALEATAIRSVVAVPANAFGAQRFVTLDAFRRAGFAPMSMLNEPSAAGFEYTHRHRDTLSSRRDHVVVYDLGGGTFDASLVRMRGRAHQVLSTAGMNELGGDDFDGVLLDRVLESAGLSRKTVPARALERLLFQCRDAKERLHPSSRKITIDLDQALTSPGAGEASVAVADFYEACAPLVDRSIEAMTPVMWALDREAPDRAEDTAAATTPDALAGIYVVGGASELPIIGRALRARFGRRVHRSPYPSAAIAIGLAIACDEEASFELSDRFGRNFGVFREGEGGSAITFDSIFASETPLPREGESLRIRRDYRAAHNLGHFRFVECGQVAADGRPLGNMILSGEVLFPFDPGLGEASDLRRVPVHRIAAGPRIEEEYALDAHGIVAITIKNVDEGYERVFRLGS